MNPTYDLIKEAEGLPEHLQAVLNQAEWIDEKHEYLTFFGQPLESKGIEFKPLALVTTFT